MVRLFGQEWTKQDLLRRVGQMGQVAGIRPYELSDGRERGVRGFEVYTGTGLSFHVLADRALDVADVRYRGVSINWKSSVGDVHPAYYEADGLGWLRSFPGGLVTTCGLDYYGAPSEDGEDSFGIHGRISNLPAQQVSYRTFWQDDDYLLQITGIIRQSRLFGENLVLERTITSYAGANTIKIEDSVTNAGFQRQPHMFLYHCNMGFPLVDDTTEIKLKTSETIARTAEAEAGLDTWNQLHAPEHAYQEQVFRHDVKADVDGMVQVRVENSARGLALEMRYAKEQLPYLYEWKQMGEGAYVLGIEPGNTGTMEGRAAARAQQDLPHLEPGESRIYALEFEIDCSF